MAETVLDFFAGSGLVSLGLAPEFETVWANDISLSKSRVFTANHRPDVFHREDIAQIDGTLLPPASLAWASFPCQDLSLAGKLAGMKKGNRSGLFWNWLRVLDEMEAAGKRVPILTAENVVGFIVGNGGRDFRVAFQELKSRGYRVGAVVVDAKLFVPQSRPRAFLIAADANLVDPALVQDGPSAPFHTAGLRRVACQINDPDWVWWKLPTPAPLAVRLEELLEEDVPFDSAAKTAGLRRMLSPVNRQKLSQALRSHKLTVGAGYRRTRPDSDGVGRQRLELRFDGLAGCLRTPGGGSSRQVLLAAKSGQVRTRLLSVRECARLMGVPDTYQIPGSYNDGYLAMGDAVAVPVTRWVSRSILAPLSERLRSNRGKVTSGRSKGRPRSAA